MSESSERRVLVLFPDTNLFVQCLPLEQLPWADLGEFAEIQLIVCRTVQAEIDKHKNQGSHRLAKRARTASALIRKVILQEPQCGTISRGSPVVRLFVKPELQPSPALRERLDYQERDNQLVGTIAAFLTANPRDHVALLTHDTGPMASAKMVNIPIVPIPDEWLLPPERVDSEKKIGTLELELARLKKTEPSFVIGCRDERGQSIETLECEIIRYTPLTPEQLSVLVSRLAQNLPRQSVRADVNALSEIENRLLGRYYVPPSAAEIKAYEDNAYPAWLKECEDALAKWHRVGDSIGPAPKFRFVAENRGSRPGKDVLVTIEVQGNFHILAPRRRSVRDTRIKNELPLPPTPPSGGLRSMEQFLDPMSAMRESLGSFGRGFPEIANLPTLPINPIPRDVNAFYWKDRPKEPSKAMSLECEQWRHGIEPEEFEGRIHLEKDQDSAKGALILRIDAENLSTPLTTQVPVRVTVNRPSAYQLALAATDQLIQRTRS